MDNEQSNNDSTVTVQVLGNLIMFVISVCVMIALSFTQKRTKMGLETCNGVPGIVSPVNFLNPRHRMIYMLAFGVVGSQLTVLIRNSVTITDNPWGGPIVQPLYASLSILFLVVYSYPILACVEAPKPLVGYILGALYTVVYLVYIVTILGLSIKDTHRSIYSQKFKNILYSSDVVSAIPQLFCLFGILFWYIYKLIKEFIRINESGEGWNSESLEQSQSKIDFTYVCLLLKNNAVKSLKNKSLTNLRLPLPIMIVAVVAGIIIFQLTVLVCFTFPVLFDAIGNLLANSSTKKLTQFSDTLTGVSILAPILSFVLSCAVFVHFIYSMRQNMIEIRKSQRELTAKPIKWPALTLGSSVRYAGYQAAAIVTGWIVYTIVIFVILLSLGLLFFLPSIFGYLYYRLAILIVWVVIVLILQIVASKLFFVTNDSTELKTVIVNNRRVFNLFSYFVFLYNVATGIMTAIFRVGISFLFMVLILPRMDRVIFVKGFEVFDLGHGMFKNFMLMESILHNPIVLVFVSLVNEGNSSLPRVNSHSPLLSANVYKVQTTNPAPKRQKCQRVINRWFVAYTLIKNPSLKEFRKSSVQRSPPSTGNDSLPAAAVNPLVSINSENV